MEYTLKRYRRAKHVRVGVNAKSEVVVTAPVRVSKKFVEEFLESQTSWIRQQQAKREAHAGTPLGASGREAYLEYREAARALVHARLAHFNSYYKLTYNRVSIRDTHSRWGSCSDSGNLNFSYKLVHLPLELSDYIIVHELCHLREHNHSPRFWALVGEVLPDYRARRAALRRLAAVG